MVFASIREHAEHCDFLRARAEIKNLLCELASKAKIWGARASEHSFRAVKNFNGPFITPNVLHLILLAWDEITITSIITHSQ